MTDRRRKRIARRIARLQRRLQRIEKWDEERHGRPIRKMVRELEDEDPDITDAEIVEALSDRVDELADLPGIWESIADLGTKGFFWIAVTVVRNRVEVLERRIERNHKRLAEA